MSTTAAPGPAGTPDTMVSAMPPVATVTVVGDPDRLHGLITVDHVAPAGAHTRFDSATDTWTVGTDGDDTAASHRTRLVIDTTPAGEDLVAVHGIPNYFRVPGPHTRRQAAYVARLVAAVRAGGAERIEARSRVRVHRRLPTRGVSRFYVSGASDSDEDLYDGPAVVTHDGTEQTSRIRLTGHFDPIDGQYHWQGMLYGELTGPKVTGSQVAIRIGAHRADARVTERTPWGTLSVVGVAGYPPFPLDDVEVTLPPRLG
ncbi:DUF4873 domain-containing protein [Mycolicibacillus koreensis]|nr:DUF4873 domain-containing protein [Mycolicibacillus koreensis]BBY56628.1 hypothetical protein MKOR_38790 [Mycolicibacillus koreensis]